MFEFSVLRKYLIPRKRHLSVSLIGLMSLVVISSVVWLILVFLSVTSGIEKNWLTKLTQLNSPIQIIPTQNYYNSYYYLIDGYAFNSSYQTKSIREKKAASMLDPYDPSIDQSLPSFFPKNPSRDLIKEAYTAIDTVRSRYPFIGAQDYEVAPSLLKMKLIRNTNSLSSQLFSQNFLTQAAYTASLLDDNPHLSSLLIAPTENDLNHLLATLSYELKNVLSDTTCSLYKKEQDSRQVSAFFTHAGIKTIKLKQSEKLSATLLPEGLVFSAYILDNDIHLAKGNSQNDILYQVQKIGDKIECKRDDDLFSLPTSSLVFFPEETTWNVSQANEFHLLAHTNDFDHPLTLTFLPYQIDIVSAKPELHFTALPSIPPLWAYSVGNMVKIPLFPGYYGVLLPKNLKDNDVVIGDVGYLSYGSFSLSKNTEQREAIAVAGFYDPGIMTVGARSILAPYELVHLMTHSSYADTIDPLLKNGIQVWFPHLNETKSIEKSLKTAFDEASLSSYFTIESFYDYPFAKDLMQQFQSDRYLFMLIGLIILTVACSNIIALLLMLVKDKKREIGIMQALGASRQSIALIFGGVGACLGLVSCFIGTLLAHMTLLHIDSIVRFLSFIQGRDAFNPLFYGTHLPNQMSMDAIIFLFIATPILSLIASLVPAMVAMKLSPTAILRSEG
ncbi:MAG: FtsX-like permease family protein [Chlamydiales bacterium]|nr:FtsX-like permease family protein [Chlamydiales bacterium]